MGATVRLGLSRLPSFNSRRLAATTRFGKCSSTLLVFLSLISVLAPIVLTSRARLAYSSSPSAQSRPTHPNQTLTVTERIRRRIQTFTMPTRTQVLQDYTIRLTSAADIPSQPSSPDASPAEPFQNPPGWHDEHRQVPPYRPINRNLDRSLRPWGSDGPETAFVMNMFTGVWVIAVGHFLPLSGIGSRLIPADDFLGMEEHGGKGQPQMVPIPGWWRILSTRVRARARWTCIILP